MRCASVWARLVLVSLLPDTLQIHKVGLSAVSVSDLREISANFRKISANLRKLQLLLAARKAAADLHLEDCRERAGGERGGIGRLP
jgi:hypothetical protein